MRNITYRLLLIKRRHCETAHVYRHQSLAQSGLLLSILILIDDSLDTIPLSVLYLLFIYIYTILYIYTVYFLCDCTLCFSFKREFYSKITIYSKSQMVFVSWLEMKYLSSLTLSTFVSFSALGLRSC